MDATEAMIRTKKQIRSLEEQIRRTRDEKTKRWLQVRKLNLESRYQNLRKAFGCRAQTATLDFRDMMQARCRRMLSPENGIETAAFVKGR